ncbi:MAG: hypothetical protein MRJ92_08045 [Nitrospira sp.]|nr:hypothetical protein [Nitrospira sp.]
MTGPGLCLFFRLLFDATLELPFGLFEISLLRDTSRQQGKPCCGQQRRPNRDDKTGRYVTRLTIEAFFAISLR